MRHPRDIPTAELVRIANRLLRDQEELRVMQQDSDRIHRAWAISTVVCGLAFAAVPLFALFA